LTLPAAQKDLDKASGRIDEAFAKTRVQLQASAPASGTRAELTEYMSKSPGERIREQLLKEQGLTEEQAQALPQEKQDAISREVAARLKEQQQVASTTAPAEPVKQALAAL
jgi:TPP-dependent pyruvate/acetoin dehydrogenase alpha subunit